MPKKKTDYEFFKTVYEGESGPPWVEYLRAREAEGWALFSAEIIDDIDDKRFRGKVVFRRPVSK